MNAWTQETLLTSINLKKNTHTSCVIVTETKQNVKKYRSFRRPQNRL